MSMQHAQYLLLLLVLAVNSSNFTELYALTLAARSCALLLIYIMQQMLVNNLCNKSRQGDWEQGQNCCEHHKQSTIHTQQAAFVAHGMRMGLPTHPSMYVHFLCKYMKQ